MKRVLGAIKMEITLDGRIVVPPDYYSVASSAFMSFARSQDQNWCNEQYRSDSVYQSEVSKEAYHKDFRVYRRGGEYRFSFGYVSPDPYASDNRQHHHTLDGELILRRSKLWSEGSPDSDRLNNQAIQKLLDEHEIFEIQESDWLHLPLASRQFGEVIHDRDKGEWPRTEIGNNKICVHRGPKPTPKVNTITYVGR